MPDPQPTRGRLGRALVVNALTKPINVVVPAAVLVAAALVGAAWLAVIAVASWLTLAAVTFFDEREAVRLGKQHRTAARSQASPQTFVPPIAKRVAAAHRARASIRATAGSWPTPLSGMIAEADALVETIEAQAASAQRSHLFLAGRPQAEPEVLERLRERHRELLSEMDAGIAALDTLHAELLNAAL
jgi:hypothetical protein